MPNSATRLLMVGVHMHFESLDFIFEMFLIGEIDVSSQRAYLYIRKKMDACLLRMCRHTLQN